MSFMVNGNTKIFGVLADPINHVKAPTYLNNLWLKKNFNQIMIPIHVSMENLETIINNLRNVKNFFGFCVTIPHKVGVYEICDHLLPSAKKTEAVNVAYFNHKRELIGANFDGLGFVKGMEKSKYQLKDKNVFIIGAGGAAKGIAFSLIEHFCKSITIFNRTKKKAVDLKDQIKKWHKNFNVNVGENPLDTDIIINTTSLGLNETDHLPLDETLLNNKQIVADIIMEPELTNFLKICLKKGIMIQKGKHMFSNQLDLIDKFLTERKELI